MLGTEMEVYFDRVLVSRVPDPETTAGGIVVPDAHKDAMRQHEGVVLAVGHGRLLPDGTVRPLITAVGDIVVFGEFAGKKLPERMGPNLVVLREDEILGRQKAAEPAA